ncbi:MAG TPA: OmpA family protein [Terriglobales bacterium]
MAESLFASLLHTLDHNSVAQVASSLGESEQGVSRGLESSVASVLGGIAGKAEDTGALRGIMNLLPENSGDLSWTKLASGLATPGSPWISTAKQLMSGIFGTGDTAVTNALSRESGIGAGSARTLLAMAAPMVIGFLSKRMKNEGLSTKDLGGILQRESGTIRSALPAGLSETFWPHAVGATASAVNPVIAQSVQPERHSNSWIGAASLAALALAGLWMWSHARRPVVYIAQPVGTANRMITEPTNNVDTNIPAKGLEPQLLSSIQNPNANSWIDFNGLTFDSGSEVLRPASAEQLNNIAATLKAYPNVRLKVGGYTDNVGTAEENMKLSRARAATVKAELVSRGINSDRLVTEGFGEMNALSNNNSSDGRATNRRVALQVSQR